jgi:hypothetical protein
MRALPQLLKGGARNFLLTAEFLIGKSTGFTDCQMFRNIGNLLCFQLFINIIVEKKQAIVTFHNYPPHKDDQALHLYSCRCKSVFSFGTVEPVIAIYPRN